MDKELWNALPPFRHKHKHPRGTKLLISISSIISMKFFATDPETPETKSARKNIRVVKSQGTSVRENKP